MVLAPERRMLLVAAAREELGDLDGEVVGVGPLVAAASAAALVERLQPECVLLLGTGGAYASGPAVGTAVVSARLGLSSGVAALGLGYVPRPPSPIDGDPALLAALPHVPRAHVRTVGAVTTDLALAERLSDGWSVEHLEAYAVAWACRCAGVPFLAVLGIANDVGPDAHVQWLTHRDAARQAARDAIVPLLEG
jgi:purine-nucleoside phosphorylase